VLPTAAAAAYPVLLNNLKNRRAISTTDISQEEAKI
jgi:hypothetical protein